MCGGVVLSIDKRERAVSLGIKHLEKILAFRGITDRFQKGQQVTGTVTMLQFGCFSNWGRQLRGCACFRLGDIKVQTSSQVRRFRVSPTLTEGQKDELKHQRDQGHGGKGRRGGFYGKPGKRGFILAAQLKNNGIFVGV